jgi:hypothetical protein
MGGISYPFIKFWELINAENILVEYSELRRPFEGPCHGWESAAAKP